MFAYVYVSVCLYVCVCVCVCVHVRGYEGGIFVMSISEAVSDTHTHIDTHSPLSLRCRRWAGHWYVDGASRPLQNEEVKSITYTCA